MESPFDVLQIGRDADEEEIEQAYRKRVKEAHPDLGGSTREFRRVRAAYEQITSGRYADRYDGHAEGAAAGVDHDHTASGVSRQGGASGVHRAGADPEGDRAEGDGRPRQSPSRVEYLNYEVLDDHGWDIDDEDLFERASEAGLDPSDCGRLTVRPDESLLQAAENRGFAWPYACRGGACANCAVAVVEGELSTPVDHILPPEMTDRGLRLSCVGAPTTEEAKVVYNVKHLPDLDELRLPPRPFEQAHLDA